MEATSPEGKKFYYATEGGNEPGAKRLFTSDSMGTGTHLTDNPLVANATAGREMAAGHGSVVPVEMPALKTFDLNMPLFQGNAGALRFFLLSGASRHAS